MNGSHCKEQANYSQNKYNSNWNINELCMLAVLIFHPADTTESIGRSKVASWCYNNQKKARKNGKKTNKNTVHSALEGVGQERTKYGQYWINGCAEIPTFRTNE
jgi:hypothetical protein